MPNSYENRHNLIKEMVGKFSFGVMVKKLEEKGYYCSLNSIVGLINRNDLGSRHAKGLLGRIGEIPKCKIEAMKLAEDFGYESVGALKRSHTALKKSLMLAPGDRQKKRIAWATNEDIIITGMVGKSSYVGMEAALEKAGFMRGRNSIQSHIHDLGLLPKHRTMIVEAFRTAEKSGGLELLKLSNELNYANIGTMRKVYSVMVRKYETDIEDLGNTRIQETPTKDRVLNVVTLDERLAYRARMKKIRKKVLPKAPSGPVFCINLPPTESSIASIG
jgi:hypothetical protein